MRTSPHRTTRLACLLTLLAATVSLATACDEDAGSTDLGGDQGVDAGPDAGGDAGADLETGDTGEEDADPVEYPTSGVLARFDLEAASVDDFFAFPYPSDLRLNERGGPDLTAFPADEAATDLLEKATRAAEQTVTGFSVVATAYFTFEAELDVATLPADLRASTRADASVFVVDVTPESPWYGRRHPVEVHYRAAAGKYWDASTLAVQPPFGFPFRPGNTYAAVVTTAVTGIDGQPVIGPPAFRALFDGGADAELAAAYAPFVDSLALFDIHPNTVSMATLFTTGAPASELFQLRTWMHENLPQPVASDLFLLENGHELDIYQGTFAMEEFLDGETPYSEFGEGTLTLSAAGEPATRTPVDLRFALSIPSGEAPEGGWPVVLYSHGTGGDYLSMRSTAAFELARRGIAVLGIDQPLHGARNPTETDELDLILNLTISNIVVGRDMLRQHVADLVQATRLLRAGIEIPAEVSASGEVIRTDPDRIAFMGHSQGAQVGALFLPVEPDIAAGVFSEGGGGAAISLLERKDNDIDIAAVVAGALGLFGNSEPLTDYHPAVGVVIQPLLDPADPLAYARHTILEPLGGTSHSLFMTEGLQDAATPPRTIESLASATGLPIAIPVASPVETIELQGIRDVALPLSGNLPAWQGSRPTGALVQYPGRNHYLTSRDAGARYQVFEFLRTALEGAPTIYPMEDL